MRKIISVANRLPVTVGRSITKSSGGLVSALDGVAGQFDINWVGWPGTSFKNSQRAKDVEKRLIEDYNCSPVFLSKKEVSAFYEGFSNGSLWPLLHYMSQYVDHDERWWDEYQKVNIYFADKVMETAKKQDLIWVHDYHLMLVPRLLRKRRPDLRIGFFLHTPFPSYEVFRCHPHRSELLEGLLGADLVGFHTFGYMRHFRSSVMRLLNLESQMSNIKYQNRNVHMGVYPIGANSGAFIKELSTDRFEKQKDIFKDTFLNKKIILSVERLDYTKGIARRLEAIDKFLDGCSYKENVCFVFVAIPSRGEIAQYQQLREQVEGLVGRINGKHATLNNTPIKFIHQSVDFTQLCALYSIADVAMITPLIDGMNLVAKEYVACKKDKPGVLMLSEFAGAAGELFKAVKVNPYDIDEMAEKLSYCLNMPLKEQLSRMKGMYERVVEYDAKYWAKTFLGDLEKYSGNKPIQATQTVNSLSLVKNKFASAKKIACFIDYDGTLREFVDDPKMASPTKQIISLLKQLQKCSRVDTYIISGRKAENLSEWFGDYNFTLVGEHGYRYRQAGTDQWKLLADSFDTSWKKQVIEVFNQYAGTTPGSFVEEKISAVVWHYRRSDPEFGKLKAQQLISSLSEMMTNMPVEVHHGKKIVEVTSMQVNKGVALMKLTRGKKYDVILCAGDDQTDESMFRIENDKLLKIKVGKGDTFADLRVASPAKFISMLSTAIKSIK